MTLSLRRSSVNSRSGATMETADSEQNTRSRYQEKVGRLFLGLTDHGDSEKQLRALAAVEWSSLQVRDAIGLVLVASDAPHVEVRVLAATILRGVFEQLLLSSEVSQELEQACQALGKLSWDGAPDVRHVVESCSEGLKRYPQLLTLTQTAVFRRIPTRGTVSILGNDIHVERLPSGDTLFSARAKDMETARELIAALCQRAQTRTIDAMNQDDVAHQDSSGQPQEESTPAVHHSTVSDASSSDPPSSKRTGDVVERAAPMEYSDWLDEDFDFAVVPARQVGTLSASFQSLGRATPTPYDFDE